MVRSCSFSKFFTICNPPQNAPQQFWKRWKRYIKMTPHSFRPIICKGLVLVCLFVLQLPNIQLHLVCFIHLLHFGQLAREQVNEISRFPVVIFKKETYSLGATYIGTVLFCKKRLLSLFRIFNQWTANPKTDAIRGRKNPGRQFLNFINGKCLQH